MAVQLTICKLLSKSLGGKSFYFLKSIISRSKPLKTDQRSCEANAAGEHSSFILTVGVKSVPRYHCKLAYAVLHIAVKESFEVHF